MSYFSTSLPGGTWALGDLTVTRFGYGAMQLAGPGVMGPPADRDGALAVLREAVGLGVTHIDMPTSPQRVWRAISDAANGAKEA